ncbi:MAG: radical SAM protein [Selenomonadaceae bacterium]|nr:radical SAM protein [Selenomonadaceae bacterium]MBR1857983.1 radical SAM protein [Selenomonadaceae bacterium]
MLNLLKKCNLCPRRCGVDRSKQLGLCGASDKVSIALVSLHQWEEPCLIGENGAGTIFFSHCNLKCCFCQNYEISHLGRGVEVGIDRLAEIFIEQQERGAANIELVTPTHYVPQIIEALDIAKSNGLQLPIVYNSNGYENVETLELMRGYVDIFLPDLKYFDDDIAIKYSNAPNYFDITSKAITKMLELVGNVQFDSNGQLQRGVIVRHLILPNHRHDSIKIIDWLYKNFGDAIYISLMNQYTPMFQASKYKKINRRLTTFEYNSVINHAIDIGVKNCYIQTGKTATKDFVPDFNCSGV